MKVEMDHRAAGPDRGEPLGRADAVKLSMKIGEPTRVAQEQPRPACEIHTHRRSGRALEDEVGSVDAHDLGRRKAALAHVTHHRDLTGGDVAAAITTQDGTRIERLQVRVTTACERF
jgi:hypothetical protein